METMTTSIILPFLVFFPFLGAVISYIIGRSNKGARDIWCWILSAVIFIASLTLIGKETVYSLRGFCGLGLSFAADGFGVILAVLTGAIWLITTIFSKEYMAAERNSVSSRFPAESTLFEGNPRFSNAIPLSASEKSIQFCAAWTARPRFWIPNGIS